MIRERIKLETAEQHKKVESVGYSSRIMSGELTMDEYKNLIQINLLLNSSFEAQWSSLCFKLPPELNLELRRKTKALKLDAEILSISMHTCSNIEFPANTYEEFMGSLYVFEGSTLGGALIAKQLAKNKNLANISQFNFYNCYGNEIGKFWKDFLGHLTLIKDHVKIYNVIEAAQVTFDLTYKAFAQVNKEG